MPTKVTKKSNNPHPTDILSICKNVVLQGKYFQLPPPKAQKTRKVKTKTWIE